MFGFFIPETERGALHLGKKVLQGEKKYFTVMNLTLASPNLLKPR